MSSSEPTWWIGVVTVPLRVVAILAGGALALVALRAFIAWLTKRLSRMPEDPGSELASILARVNPLALARRRRRAKTVGSVLLSVLSLVIVVTVVLLVLDELGVNLTPFLASLGVLGVGIGIGAQSLVRDLLTGLFILAEDQYGVGDVIDIGETSGTVESVGLRVTTIRDDHGSLWFVPNGSIVRVANKTQRWASATVQVDVDYFADPQVVIEALTAAAATVNGDPEVAGSVIGEPTVTGIDDMSDGTLRFTVTVRTSPAQQWEVARRLRLAIRATLLDAGIAWAGQSGPAQPVRARPDADPEEEGDDEAAPDRAAE